MVVRELDAGGIERDVTRTVLALDREGFEPHVAAFYPLGMRFEELRQAGVPVLNMPVRTLLSPAALRLSFEFGRYLHKHRIRIVHAWDNSAVFAIPVSKLCQVPVLVSSVLGHRSLVPRKILPLLRFTDQLADAVVTNCKFLAMHLLHDENLPRQKINVCYNGVDSQQFHPPKNHVSGEGGILTIGTVSGLRPVKNLELLLHAFAKLSATCSKLHLVIVGSGECYPRLKLLRSRLSLGDSCLFISATPNVIDWLHAMDVFVLPSRSEGMSNALLEAMACGRAIVATRVGGTPELLGHNERGLLFESDDVEDLVQKLKSLIDDVALRTQLGTSAAEFARGEFSVEKSVSRFAALYRRLLINSGLEQ
jgi:glycosyltransferase involved in cell wall biosynthesis